jgi:alpha-1,2-mannosyltransferase
MHKVNYVRRTKSEWWLLLALFFILYAWFFIRHGVTCLNITHLDLPSFYAASVQVFRNGGSPYDLEQLVQINGADVQTLPWLYPPTSLFVFFPLAYLTYAKAQSVVLVMNHALFIALAWFLPLGVCRLQPERRFWAVALCLAYTLVFGPIFVTLYSGQINLVLLASLVIFWTAAKSSRPVVASLFLALAIVLKTYPLVLLPLLLLIDGRRIVMLTLGWLVCMAVFSLLVLPSGLWTEWLSTILPSGVEA